MKSLNLQKLATLGTLGLSTSAIALLGIPLSVQADDTCGPGANWVDTCTAGVDEFETSIALLDILLIDPITGNPTGSIFLELTGPATVTRGNPVDFVGTVGNPDGNLGVIPLELEESFTGQGFTLTGTGTGFIIEATESGIPDSTLASSFFDVFAEIEGSFGTAANVDPIRVDGDRWLVGVPPDEIPGQFPPPPLPVTPDPQCGVGAPPEATIIYCGFEDVEFFLVDDNGDFILDTNGDPILVAILQGEQHVVLSEVPRFPNPQQRWQCF